MLRFDDQDSMVSRRKILHEKTSRRVLVRSAACLLTLFAAWVLTPDAADAQDYHRVRPYVRSDGTYVRGHYRTNPDGIFSNNWSTVGNVNPFTGKPGWIPYPYSGLGSGGVFVPIIRLGRRYGIPKNWDIKARREARLRKSGHLRGPVATPEQTVDAQVRLGLRLMELGHRIEAEDWFRRKLGGVPRALSAHDLPLDIKLSGHTTHTILDDASAEEAFRSLLRAENYLKYDKIADKRYLLPTQLGQERLNGVMSSYPGSDAARIAAAMLEAMHEMSPLEEIPSRLNAYENIAQFSNAARSR